MFFIIRIIFKKTNKYFDQIKIVFIIKMNVVLLPESSCVNWSPSESFIVDFFRILSNWSKFLVVLIKNFPKFIKHVSYVFVYPMSLLKFLNQFNAW